MSNASVYGDLRAAIASGNIRPHARLIETELMERFEAGRPAVRIALARLEQEGLVEQAKNHTARVRLIEADEAIEISEARTLLECYAVGVAARKATAADAEELRALADQSESARKAGLMSDVLAMDTRFHQRILEIADNRTIMRLHGGLHGHLMRHHQRTRLEQEASRTSPLEHRAIAEAIAAHDPSAAADAMREHLDRLTEMLRQVLERAFPDSAAG
jgi:DNA-binding GntR family transcriptional regulator